MNGLPPLQPSPTLGRPVPGWLVPALILLLGVGVIYAWVLHIEILR